jgi:type IX secretion system PorP/SprF family membrane protein
MKKLIITLNIILGASMLNAQVIPQFSQYYQNYLIHNPAASGMEDYWEIKTNFRKQWVGLSNSPISGYLTFSGVLNGKKFMKESGVRTFQSGGGKGSGTVRHGLGGYVILDNFGPITQYAGGLSYAAHVRLFKNVKLSIGTSVGLNNMQLRNDLTIKDVTDATYSEFMLNGMNQTFLDWNVGFYLYSPNFFLGYGANHLLGNMVRFGDNLAEREVNMHHFISGGYRFVVGKNIEILPSVQVKFMMPAPVSFDISTRIRYKKMVWAGVGYRNEDAISAMFGFTIGRVVNVGYAYDYTLNSIRSYSSGSHEVMLGFNIGAKKRIINQYTW